jgi:L-threonylcarbamoyladenylate synthase
MRRWILKEEPTQLQLSEIARILQDGKVVLLPTDTIYGLHALATDEAAVNRIVELKGRDDTKPFIVIAASIEQLRELGVSADDAILERLAQIWPAPLTAILPLAHPVPASRGAATIAVRIPALEWLRALASRSGPLVSTSANRSGEAPVESPSALARDVHDQLDGVIDGGPRTGRPSALVDLTGPEPRLLREGEHSFTQKVWKTLRKSG